MKKLIDKLKKMKKKTLLILIAAAVVLVATVTVVLVIVFNRDKEDPAPGPQDTVTDSDTQTEPQDTTPPDDSTPVEEPSFLINMKDYKVIYDDKATDRVMTLATTFAQKIATPLGISEIAVDVDNEWNTPQAKELLIGISNRDESKQAFGKTGGKFTYNISVIGDKICVAAPTAELLEDALEYLYDQCIAKSAGDGTFPYLERMRDYTPEEIPHISVIESGNCLFNVVYPKSATVGTPVSVAAIEIRDFLQKYTSDTQEVAILNDYANSMGEFDLTQPSVVIGNTQYPRSQEIADGMTYFGWAMEYLDRQFYLFSEDAASATVLRKELLDLFASGLYLDGTKNIRVCIPESRSGFYADWCEEIPEYVPVTGEENVTLHTISEFTEGYFRIYLENVTPEGYASYVNLVKNSGYTLYQESSVMNAINSKDRTNYFATYKGKNTVLHLYYLEYQNALRVLVCQKDTFVDYKTQPEQLPNVTKPTMTIMDMVYSKQAAEDNGLGLVFTLQDGSYIIYDGGYSYDTEKLYNYLKENNKYGDGSKIYIRAWVLTHPHMDHFGNYVEFAKLYGRIVTLENAVYQFDYEGAMNPNMTAGGTSAAAALKDVLNDVKNATQQFIGAKLITPLAGQTLYFGDAKIEIMATSEMLYPNVTANQNDHSLISRVTLAGSTVLITGDTASSTMHMKTLERVYGSQLQSIFMTAPHHGLNGSTSFYTTVRPRYVIFPTEQDDFENRTSVDGGYGFNVLLVDEMKRHEKFLAGEFQEDGFVHEMIVADNGDYNGYHVLYLPYMGADYYESDFENGNYDGGQVDSETWEDLTGSNS